jgi:hypothetical protein
MRTYYKGVAISGHCLHGAVEGRHSKSTTTALCGASIYLDRPFAKNVPITCKRCKRKLGR